MMFLYSFSGICAMGCGGFSSFAAVSSRQRTTANALWAFERASEVAKRSPEQPGGEWLHVMRGDEPPDRRPNNKFKQSLSF